MTRDELLNKLLSIKKDDYIKAGEYIKLTQSGMDKRNKSLIKEMIDYLKSPEAANNGDMDDIY